MPETKEKNILEEQEQVAHDNLELRFITKRNAVFTDTGAGFMGLDFAGEHYQTVDFYRAFPLTSPNHYISVRTHDDKKTEIGVIKNMSDIEKSVAALIETQLKRRYFTPLITRIYTVKQQYGYTYFDVKTTSGRCRFITPHSGASARLSETRVIFTDIDGNRFEVADLNRLSPKEIKKIDLFI